MHAGQNPYSSMRSQVELENIYEGLPLTPTESPGNNPNIPERSYSSSSFTDDSYIQSIYNGHYR